MENTSRIYPTNPLGIIATFVFFIEAITASSLHFLTNHPLLLEKMVHFIIAFPSVIALSFFGILIFRREILFAPSDFKDENNFITILRKIELDQKIVKATLDPPSNIESTFLLVDELIRKGETRNVIRMGRAYLKLKEFQKAGKFFEHVKEKTSTKDLLYYKILLNIAYAHIGLAEYQLALNNLRASEPYQPNNNIWFAAAMAYVLSKLGLLEEANIYLAKTRKHVNFMQEKNKLNIHFPDFEY